MYTPIQDHEHRQGLLEQAVARHQAWLDRSPDGGRVNWSRQAIEGARLRAAILDRALLADAKIVDSNFSNARMIRADLSGGTWRRVGLDRVDFTGADMTRMRIEQIHAPYACLHETRLVESTFVEALLDDSRWLEAVIDRTRFQSCTLRRAVFNQTRVFGSDFGGCDFTGANLCHTRIQLSKFARAVFRQARITDARCSDCNFTGADFRGSSLARTDWSRSSFVKARLVDCDLRGARFAGADLSEVVLQGSALYDAVLTGANLSGADLRGAREVSGTQLIQARTDNLTILPNGSRGPYRRQSGAERP
jgi:uncharacterized protein YjbI with pentapeptide repeats